MDKNLSREHITLVVVDEASQQEMSLEPGTRLVLGRYESSSKLERLPQLGQLEDGAVHRTRQYRSRSLDVSQRHAEIRVTADLRVFVKDLDSTNGTLVRLAPYQDFELQPNTEVQCGRSLVVQRRTPLWESIEENGRYEGVEDFVANVAARLKEYGAEAHIVHASEQDSRRVRGLVTRLPLPFHSAYIVVTWKKATFNLALERWLQTRVLLFNSGSLCVPLGSHDRVEWRFRAATRERQRVLKLARRVAATDGTVLLCGPTGVGKDVLAHDIHNHSSRAGGPFRVVNCAALPATLAESELFGTERGAFSDAVDRPGCFEQAHGGTLFLDEIGEMPLDLQAKLLRVIEDKRVRRVGSTTERPVNVRLIAATNRNLPEMVSSGQFRADLWFRLEGVQLTIPDLQGEDICALVTPLCLDLVGDGLPEPSEDELEQLSLLACRREWRGNARQLRNALMRYLTYRDPLLSVDENWQTALSINQDSKSSASSGASSERGVVSGCSAGDEAMPTGVMSIVVHLDRLLTLTVARHVLFPQRRGAWAELGRRLDLTGPGAQEKIRRLGLSTDPPSDLAQVDRGIEEARSALQPYLAFLNKVLNGRRDE